MRKDDIKTIKNGSGREVVVLINGQREEIKPGQVLTLTATKADAFIAKCSDVVEIKEVPLNFGGVQADTLAGATVFIANMTGNPNAPETIVARRMVREGGGSRTANVEVANPNREPRLVGRDMDLGQSVVSGRSGDESLNHGKLRLEIPPYQRVQWPVNAAEWFINRDSMMEQECRGQVRRCRPPSPSDPDLHWDLDDLRSYYELVFGKAPVCPTEKALRTRHTDDAELLDVILHEKQKLMQELFFVVVDPKAPHFTR